MASSQATRSGTKVITGPVRLSYAHLFEAYTNDPEKEARYSTAILIPKSDKRTIKFLKEAQREAIENAVTAGKIKLRNGKVPPAFKQTLHDGDEDADLERNPEYAGHMYLNAASKVRPGVVDRNLDTITDSTEVYSGCFARVSLNAYCYSTQGSQGVTFGLGNVQKLRDGEPLGGRSRAEDDFDVEDDDDDFDDESDGEDALI